MRYFILIIHSIVHFGQPANNNVDFGFHCTDASLQNAAICTGWSVVRIFGGRLPKYFLNRGGGEMQV